MLTILDYTYEKLIFFVAIFKLLFLIINYLWKLTVTTVLKRSKTQFKAYFAEDVFGMEKSFDKVDGVIKLYQVIQVVI